MQVTAAISRGTGAAPALEPVELEAPRAGEMLIRLVATGICHTDLHEHPGRHAPQPIVLGHEGAGGSKHWELACAASKWAIT
jgi:aryl-alcohol dehydrogenase